jgi:predicted small lipoprotein YifL
MRTLSGRAALAALASLILLAGCGRTGPNDPEAADRGSDGREGQAEAQTLFNQLCTVRGFGEARCACMRERMDELGPDAVALVGAAYSGDWARAAALEAEMDGAEREAAVDAYLAAEAACADQAAGQPPAAASGAPAEPTPPATLDDVRASCRPAMEGVCACRARALERILGDGAFEAAIAINEGSRARLDTVAAGREPGWANLAVSAYARTSASCIAQAGDRR